MTPLILAMALFFQNQSPINYTPPAPPVCYSITPYNACNNFTTPPHVYNGSNNTNWGGAPYDCASHLADSAVVTGCPSQ